MRAQSSFRKCNHKKCLPLFSLRPFNPETAFESEWISEAVAEYEVGDFI